jgi:alkylated DNA repair protein (DNA oxidative demethylase)
MNLDLFESDVHDAQIAPGAMWFHGLALSVEKQLLADVERVVAAAPFRHMLTPGGRRMSVAMTNCGTLGWVTDQSGYRYDSRDPTTGEPWPPMPATFTELAATAADRAGFSRFVPDSCLINRYEPGTRLSLHQDKDEHEFDAPIVSVSLGLPAVFLFGGLRRADTPQRLLLEHGDVVVWGGPARLRYHGIHRLEDGRHPVVGPYRINLTFRKAL